MNDLETTVLSARLHQLADELTPAVDPRRQVADARARHHRKRRVRITLIAVATATAAVAVGTVSAVDLLSVDRSRDVATPTDPTPTEPTATPTPTPTPAPAPVDPAAWEARSYMGLTFAVPPGARTADTVDDAPVSQWEGPTFTWNGPVLGGDVYSFVSVEVTDPYEDGLPPLDGGDWYTVPGADDAYGAIGEPDPTLEEPDAVGHTFAMMAILSGDRVFHVNAWFPAGPEGEQMAQRLLDSLAVEAVEAAPVVPAGWQQRTFMGLTFAVPSGARMDDYVEPNPPAESDGGPTFVWNGPLLSGDAYAWVRVQTGTGEVILPEDARPVSVPGAVQAHEWFGSIHVANPADPSSSVETVGVVVDIATPGGYFHVTAQFVPGPEGEQMAQDLIASLSVG